MIRRLLSTALVTCSILLGSCAGTGLQTAGPVYDSEHTGTIASGATTSARQRLKVMTLNLAHGRGPGRHQLLQSTETIQANLLTTAQFLQRYAPDVVALQEADGPSFWSGRFDHVEYLATSTGLRYVVHAEHVKGPGLSYGTALASRIRPSNPASVTFDPDLSPFPKGFVVATLPWPDAPSIAVDVVSLHLDFLSEAARRAQAAELIATLKQRGNAVVVMGDFNSQWTRDDSAVRLIAAELCLSTLGGTDSELATFPRHDSRLDWILISRELKFVAYETLPESVSDHRGVLAEITPSQAALAVYSRASP